MERLKRFKADITKRLKKFKNKTTFKVNINERINKLRNRTLLLVLGIIGVTLGLIGVSYAIFTAINRSNDQVIRSGSLVIRIPNFENEGLRLTAPMTPMSNSSGNAQAGYEFTITNEGTLNSAYIIRIFADTGNEVNGSNLHVSVDGTVKTPNPSLAGMTTTNGITIFESTIDRDASISHNVRVWIKDSGHDSSVVEGNDIRLRLEVENVVATNH